MAPNLTVSELKKMSRDELNEMAEEFELDPEDFTNKGELAQAIFDAQEAAEGDEDDTSDGDDGDDEDTEADDEEGDEKPAKQPKAPKAPRVAKPLANMKAVRTAVRAAVAQAEAAPGTLITRNLVGQEATLEIGVTLDDGVFRFSYEGGTTNDQRALYRFLGTRLGLETEKPAEETPAAAEGEAEGDEEGTSEE